MTSTLLLFAIAAMFAVFVGVVMFAQWQTRGMVAPGALPID